MAVILIIALLFVACNDKTGLPSSTVDTTEDIVLNDNTSHAPETTTKENSQKKQVFEYQTVVFGLRFDICSFSVLQQRWRKL